MDSEQSSIHAEETDVGTNLLELFLKWRVALILLKRLHDATDTTLVANHDNKEVAFSSCDLGSR